MTKSRSFKTSSDRSREPSHNINLWTSDHKTVEALVQTIYFLNLLTNLSSGPVTVRCLVVTIAIYDMRSWRPKPLLDIMITIRLRVRVKIALDRVDRYKLRQSAGFSGLYFPAILP